MELNKPGKIICVGLNYRSHALELDMQIPYEPVIFLKPVTSFIRHLDSIEYPSMAQRVDFEAELAVVIKQKAKFVKKENAFEYVKGYTCLNDVTARDLQKKDGQWGRAKSFDTFCPIGPHVVSDIEPHHLKIRSFLNGELKQDASTEDLIFKVDELISFISKIMTLEENDIIATGTPPGIGPMQKGDEIEIKIEGIGTLRNNVR